MTKCRKSRIYEQVGDNKLVTCRLPKGECAYQGEKFNSSDSPKEYVICDKKGSARKTTKEELLQRELFQGSTY